MKRIVIGSLIIGLMAACNPTEKRLSETFDWQGHRGARGNMPENTWPAFQLAMDAAMTTLEMDVVISGDSQVVVSHEPFMSHEICLDTAGEKITEASEKQFNIFQMTYDGVREFDCGSTIHPRFLKQEKRAVQKPLLKEILRKVKLYAQSHDLPLPYLNVEIKYVAGQEGVYHPDIALFSQLVFEVLNEGYPVEKWNIQSFDFDVLKYWHESYPNIKLTALVEDNIDLGSQLAYLGFVPEIYSPNYLLLNASNISAIHEKGMFIIPWTVNEKEEMMRLKKMGVDGIITDYPKVAAELKDIQ